MKAGLMSAAEFDSFKTEHCLRRWGEYTQLAVREPVPQVRASLKSAADAWLLLADIWAAPRPDAE
jgi:hypothetical protein